MDAPPPLNNPDEAQDAEHSLTESFFQGGVAALFSVAAQFQTEVEAKHKLQADLDAAAAVIAKLQADLAASHAANQDLITKAASDQKTHDEVIAVKDAAILNLNDDLNQSQRKMRHWRHKATKATRTAQAATAELEEQKKKEMWERTPADKALDVNYLKRQEQLEAAWGVEKEGARDTKDYLVAANRELTKFHLERDRLEERIVELVQKEKRTDHALAALAQNATTRAMQGIGAVYRPVDVGTAVRDERTAFSEATPSFSMNPGVPDNNNGEALSQKTQNREDVIKEEPDNVADDTVLP